MKTKSPRSLKTILMVYFMSTLCVFCSVIVLLSVFAVKSIVRRNTISNYMETTRYIGKNIENEFETIGDISNYMFVNNDIKTLIANAGVKNYAYYRAVGALDSLLMQNVLSNVYSNLSAVVVFSNNEIVYQYTTDEAFWRNFDFQTLSRSDEYFTAMNARSMVLSSHNFYSLKNTPPALAAVRCVMDRSYQNETGGVLLLFKPSLVENVLTTLNGNTAFTPYLIGTDEQPLRSDQAPLPAEVHAIWSGMEENLPDSPFYRQLKNGKIVYFYPIPRQKCCVIFVLRQPGLWQQSWKLLLIALMAMLFGVATYLIIWHSLRRRVVTPLVQIRSSIEEARNGVHLPIVEEKSSSIAEIEALVSSYNENVRCIDELAQKLSEETVRQKELEYKALQSQINSHFITNTLNAIRWLAIIQKSYTIKDIIDAFSRLLKSTWQGLDQDSSIGQELSNVKDYIFIQQISHAYNCDFQTDIPEDLLQVPCPKFILQPIVENAFFHGIAPKGGTGIIRVSAHPVRDGAAIAIEVYDDGIGMDELTQRQVLGEDTGKKHFNGIGVSNVQQRLQMKYGADYGITVESQTGAFTRMIICIPKTGSGETVCGK